MAIIKVTLHKVSELDRAIVSLEGSGGESVSHEFSLPWADSESWKAVFSSLDLYEQDPRTWPKDPRIIQKSLDLGLFVGSKPAPERLKAIGTELFDAVFGSEEIRSLFSRLLLQNTDSAPLVELHIPHIGSILHAYPWELLHDKSDFLFDSWRAFLVRHVDFEMPVTEIDLNSALRVLLVDPRPDMSRVGYDSLPLLDRPYLERLSNERPGQLIISEFNATLSLESTLANLHHYFLDIHEPTHIVHIDTHGDFGWLCECKNLNFPNSKVCKKCKAPKTEGQIAKGFLAFQVDNAALAWISGDDLSRQLYERGLGLVVLSACKSGLMAGSSAFNGIAGELIRRGIPAVAAMQFSFGGRASEIFVDCFYKALLQGKTVTESMSEARVGLSTEMADSWYRPVLYLRTDPKNSQGKIFAFEPSHIERELFLETGTMSPESRFYVQRQADFDCWEYIAQGQAATVAIRGPRQIGKSSLVRRVLQKAKRTNNVDTAYIDFQKFPEQLFSDEEAFLIELCYMIGDALNVPEAIDKYWSGKRRSFIVKCSNYVSQCIIPYHNAPIILAFDEIERMLTCPFRNDFFGMLRTWHNDRAYDGNFSKMSLLLGISTEPHLFIDNPNQSPFNVAVSVPLHDFTLTEVQDLNRRHRIPLSQTQVNDLMHLLGGHPFLTRLALYLVATHKIAFIDLLETATSEVGPFGDHLSHYWQHALRNPEIKGALYQVCHYRALSNENLYYRLNAAGLIYNEAGRVLMRNNLYTQFFTERLDG